MLIDTDVLVECLRGSADARTWLRSIRQERLEIPGVVAMELVMGCRTQTELQQLQRFLESFAVIWPEASEFAQAYELLVGLRLSCGIGIPDCLIAAMALSRSTRLYTFNLKHFRAVQALDVQEPYSR